MPVAPLAESDRFFIYNKFVAKKTFRIEWDAHEYEHKERSSDWYWAVGIIAVAAAIATIIFGDVIFGILILLSTFCLALFINRPPETTHVVINEFGITRGTTLYPFSTLQSFWVDEIHPHKKIILRSKKLLMPLIIVPLGDEDGERIRDLLVEILPEEPLRLPWVEVILEYLGF